MIIGKFTQHEDGYIYTGSVYGIGFSVPFVVFTPVSPKQGTGPDFVVSGGTSEEDGVFELGAAWSKTSKAGKAYLSIKLDGPMLAAPINCALIKQPDGSHALVWSRKEKAADEQPAAEEAAAA